MKHIPILLLSVLLLSGCRLIPFWPESTEEYEEAKATQVAITQEEEEKSRQLTTAVVEVLHDEPVSKATPRSKLALEFAQQDQLIEGMPLEKIPVQDYIELAVSENEDDIKKLNKKISDLEESISEFRKEKLENQTVLDARTEELVKKGMIYEEENKKKAWEKVWGWAKGTFGIGGLIALAVLFPAIIPILGHMVGAVIKLIPSLASALGVVAKSTTDAVIKGVQGTRQHLKTSSQETYTKAEVIALLDSNLDFHQSKGDKTLISRRKQKIQI